MSDDYDFEAILETLEPLYQAEGAVGVREFLAQSPLSAELGEKLIEILHELSLVNPQNLLAD